MPLNVSKLGEVLKTLNRLEGIKEFNATLPVKIEVKKEINPIRYLIRLGNRELETKSYFKLEVGKEYYAQIQDLKGKINISNLREIPKIFHIIKNEINLPAKELTHFSKQVILEHLANSNTKAEFIFFTNLFLAQNQKIYHIIINERKKALMQYKYTKNRVKFYAVFEHLAEIEGEITPSTLTIHSPYSATIALIEQYKDEINLKVYTQKKEVKPLYVISENLINLKA